MTRRGFYEYVDRNPGMRYGQAFCNYFNVTDEYLYYTEDKQDAHTVVLDYFEKWHVI